jgi:hypothetical protein
MNRLLVRVTDGLTRSGFVSLSEMFGLPELMGGHTSPKVVQPVAAQRSTTVARNPDDSHVTQRRL